MLIFVQLLTLHDAMTELTKMGKKLFVCVNNLCTNLHAPLNCNIKCGNTASIIPLNDEQPSGATTKTAVNNRINNTNHQNSKINRLSPLLTSKIQHVTLTINTEYCKKPNRFHMNLRLISPVFAPITCHHHDQPVTTKNNPFTLMNFASCAKTHRCDTNWQR